MRGKITFCLPRERGKLSHPQHLGQLAVPSVRLLLTNLPIWGYSWSALTTTADKQVTRKPFSQIKMLLVLFLALGNMQPTEVLFSA